MSGGGGLPLPLFHGKLEESWELHESNWLLVQEIPFHSKRAVNVLQLSLKSTAARDYYNRSQPRQGTSSSWNKVSFQFAIEECRKIWVNQNLKRAQKLVFETELLSRSYKQTGGRVEETMKDLINDLESLFSKIGHLSDQEKRSYFINCFLEFPEICHALSFGETYTEAVQEAITFENMVCLLKRKEAVVLQESRFPPSGERPTHESQEEEEEEDRFQGFPVIREEGLNDQESGGQRGGEGLMKGTTGNSSRFVFPFSEEISNPTLEAEEEEGETPFDYKSERLQQQQQVQEEPLEQKSSSKHFEFSSSVSLNLDPLPSSLSHHQLSPSHSTPPSNRPSPSPRHRQQLSNQSPRPPLPISFHSPLPLPLPPPLPSPHLQSSFETENNNSVPVPERISTPNFIQEATNNLSHDDQDSSSIEVSSQQQQELYNEIQSPLNSFKSSHKLDTTTTFGKNPKRTTRSLLLRKNHHRPNLLGKSHHHSRSFSLPHFSKTKSSCINQREMEEEEEEEERPFEGGRGGGGLGKITNESNNIQSSCSNYTSNSKSNVSLFNKFLSKVRTTPTPTPTPTQSRHNKNHRRSVSASFVVGSSSTRTDNLGGNSLIGSPRRRVREEEEEEEDSAKPLEKEEVVSSPSSSLSRINGLAL